jgi:hypothetical protein
MIPTTGVLLRNPTTVTVALASAAQLQMRVWTRGWIASIAQLHVDHLGRADLAK